MKFWRWGERRRREADLERELRNHLDLEAEEQQDAGMSSEEAAWAARRALGNTAKIKEDVRAAWGFQWLETLLQDLRYGLRQLRRNPGFTVVAVLTLALGIGANTAIFSVANAVMLKSLPVKNPDQLVLLGWASQKNPTGLHLFSGVLKVDPTGRVTGLPFSYPSFKEFQRGNRVFSGFFGFSSVFSVNFSAEGRANVAEEELVTGDFFSGLGVAPILGRSITGEDEKAGAPSVAVISYGFWSRYFSRNPAAVGKGITINGVPCTVIGVAPPQFFGVRPGRAVEIWVPLAQNTRLLPAFLLRTPGESSPFTSLTSWWVETMGRLKPGVTARQAQAQLEVLFQQSRRGLNAHAKPQSIPHIHLEPGAKGLAFLREKFSTPLWILTVIVGFVLMIACANIAALLVARSAARQQEIALRLSLGASRARLVRQLLTESVLLAAMGGATGVLFAHWASRALVLLMSSGGQPLALVVQLDARVLGFTAAVSIITGILFGLAPALRSARAGLAPALKAGTGGASALSKRTRMGLAKSLVTTQVALALLLAIGAGLFVRTLKALEGQNLGFDQHDLLLFTVNPERNGYEGKRLTDFYARLRARVQALPGVRSATMSEEPPVYGNEWNDNVPVEVDGYKPEQGNRLWANWNTVGPFFFKTLGIPLTIGRGIESRDTAASPKVAVVNEAFVREAFKGRDPIGHKVRLGTFTWEGKPEFEIVGLAQDARYASPRKAPWPTIYIPYTQLPTMLGGLNFELRTSGDPMALVPAARGAVHKLDPDLPISEARTQTQQIDDTLAQERLFGRLSSFFGVLAVLLACLGLYGVISYSVTQSTHEIGIRMALGAEKRDVLRMVVGQGLRLVLIGVAIGVAGALALTRFLSSLLYGVKPTDPLTFVAVSLILVAVALLACYIPARRAAKVDPMVALRYE